MFGKKQTISQKVEETLFSPSKTTEIMATEETLLRKRIQMPWMQMPFASKDSPLKNNRDALTTISVSNVENPDTPPQNTEPFCKQDKAIHSHFHPN